MFCFYMLYFLFLYTNISCLDEPIIYEDSVLIRPAIAKEKHLSARTLDVSEGEEKNDLFNRQVLKGIAKYGSIPYNRLFNKTGQIGLNKTNDKLKVGTEWNDKDVDTNVAFVIVANSHHRIMLNDLCLKYEDPDVVVTKCPKKNDTYEDAQKYEWIIESYVRKEDLEKCKSLVAQAEKNPRANDDKPSKNGKNAPEKEEEIANNTPETNSNDEGKQNDELNIQNEKKGDSTENQNNQKTNKHKNTFDKGNENNIQNQDNKQQTYNTPLEKKSEKQEPLNNENNNISQYDTAEPIKDSDNTLQNHKNKIKDQPNIEKGQNAGTIQPQNINNGKNTNKQNPINNYNDINQEQIEERTNDAEKDKSMYNKVKEDDENFHAKIYDLLKDLSLQRKQNLHENRASSNDMNDNSNVEKKINSKYDTENEPDYKYSPKNPRVNESEDSLISIYRFLHQTINDYQRYRSKINR